MNGTDLVAENFDGMSLVVWRKWAISRLHFPHMNCKSFRGRNLLVVILLWLCAAGNWAQAQIGGLDPSFNPGTILNGAAPGVIKALAVQSDGKTIVAGDFTSIGGTARGRIARFNVDG